MKKFSNSKRKTKKLTQDLDASIDDIKMLLQRRKKIPMKFKVSETKVDDSLLDLLRKTGF
jgi:hypothetical protein